MKPSFTQKYLFPICMIITKILLMPVRSIIDDLILDLIVIISNTEKMKSEPGQEAMRAFFIKHNRTMEMIGKLLPGSNAKTWEKFRLTAEKRYSTSVKSDES